MKSAPLSLALRERGVNEIVLHTGQHYDPELSAVFFDELELSPPAHQLETGSGTHGEQTGKMLPGIEAAVVDAEDNARRNGVANAHFRAGDARKEIRPLIAELQALAGVE